MEAVGGLPSASLINCVDQCSRNSLSTGSGGQKPQSQRQHRACSTHQEALRISVLVSLLVGASHPWLEDVPLQSSPLSFQLHWIKDPPEHVWPRLHLHLHYTNKAISKQNHIHQEPSWFRACLFLLLFCRVFLVYCSCFGMQPVLYPRLASNVQSSSLGLQSAGITECVQPHWIF